MAHITKRAGRPKPYFARWIDPTGRERAKAFARKVDAEAHLVNVEASKLRRDYVDAGRGRMTFGEYSARVRSQKVNQRPSTRARDDVYFRSLILPEFGEMPLALIELDDVRTWLTRLQRKQYAPATTRKAFQLFASILREAVRDKRIARTQCADISSSDLPKIEVGEMRFLSRSEIGALVSAMDPHYRPLIVFASATGLRFGELAALRVKHVDQLRLLVHVKEGMTDVEGRLRFGPLKTAASRRTISVPKFVVDTIAELMTRRAELGPEDLVFVGKNGAPLRASNFRQRFWAPAVSASVGPPCRFHDLRHSHAALLVEAGVHAKVIQRRLGHSSIKTTLDTYGHIFEGLDLEASNAFEKAWLQDSEEDSAAL
ncbi:MAG: tyrosine-type recombinase/integrase [Actinomycetota bacterium]